MGTNPIDTDLKTEKLPSFKEAFLNFAETTSLNGFNWIARAHCTLERILFSILVIISIILTLKDVIILTQSFLLEEKKTTTTVVEKQSFMLDMNLCIDIDTASFITPGINDSESVKELLDSFARENITDYLANLRLKESQANCTDEEVSLVSLTAQMLANIIRVEQIVDDGSILPTIEDLGSWGILEKVVKNNNDIDNSGGEMKIRKGTEKFMFEVNQFYVKQNVSFDKLLKQIGAIICKWHALELTETPNPGIKHTYKAKEVCLPEFITWFGAGPKSGRWEQVCIQPESGFFVFNNKIGGVLIEFNHKIMYDIETIDMEGTLINNGNEPGEQGIQLDFAGIRVYSIEMSTNNQFYTMLTKQNCLLHINGINKAISTGHEPCSSDLKKSDCWLGCRASYIAQNCHCWPLSGFGLPQRPNDIPLCGSRVLSVNNSTYVPIPIVTEANTCGMIFNESAPDVACRADCLPNCEQLLMIVINEDLKKISKQRENSTILEIVFDPSPFPVFEQSLSMTSNDYLNQLGGALGLYLGKNNFLLEA